jgi:hypothetical protein
MAKTKIRRKSLSNKKKRSNKKKSVRRHKKGGDNKPKCEGDIRVCRLDKNTEENAIINLNALATFVESHPDCNVFESSIIDNEYNRIRIEKTDLVNKIAEIRKERENGNSTKANKLTITLVEKIPSIHAKEECSIEP